MLTYAIKWRDSEQLRRIQSRLKSEIKRMEDERNIMISKRLAVILLEVCDQAIRTEEGHGL
jgi:hypothetical protein